MRTKEPIPQQLPGVLNVKLYGRMAKDAANEFKIGPKAPDPKLSLKIKKESDEELEARREAGLSGFLPEKHPFSRDFDRGLPYVSMERFIGEVFAAQYFLISADHKVEAINEVMRDEARLAFSRKESDLPLKIAGPSESAIRRFFEGRIVQYVHLHDKRRIHAGTGEEIGNNIVDLCGQLLDESVCTRHRVLHLGSKGKYRDGIFGYDFLKEDFNRKERSSSPRPMLTHRPLKEYLVLGERW